MALKKLAVVGLDVGTTGIKGLLVDEQGEILGKVEHPLLLNSPHPGWAEQDPEDWWFGVAQVLKKLGEIANESGYTIGALSTSGQMHSLVAVDKKGVCTHRSILWCDQRTHVECEEITSNIGGFKRTIEILGNPVLPGFTAGKVLWLRKNSPEALESAHKLMLPKDFINYRLTGRIVTEHSDASGTAMYDIRRKTWSDEVLRVLKLEREKLPDILESKSVVGLVRQDVSSELGLGREVLVVAGGADNACAALGIGITNPGHAMISVGTSGTVLAPTVESKPDPEGKVHLFVHVVEGMNYYMGVMLSATHTLNWFADLLGDRDYDKINREVEKVSPGARGLIVLPYLNGERTPHNDPYARAVVFGLSSSHTRWEIYRAVFEAVAFGLRDCFDALPFKEFDVIRVTGGGAKSVLWLKIMASVVGTELRIVNTQEGAAYGAAMLAFSALTSKKPEEIARSWVKDTGYMSPIPGVNYDEILRKYRTLYVTLRELFRS